MTRKLFTSMYHALARKIEFDRRGADSGYALRLVPEALSVTKSPVLLYETGNEISAMFCGYYPLDEDTYNKVYPRASLVRYNLNNLYNKDRGRAFTCGLDRRDNICHMYAVIDLPSMPRNPAETEGTLFFLMGVFASSLGIQLPPVELERNHIASMQKGGRGYSNAPVN